MRNINSVIKENNASFHEKKDFDIMELVILIYCVLMFILMLIRAFYGIEFTDEAFTVSDTLTIMSGNIPFTYNTVIAAGQSFIPIILYKIYEFVVPNMTGIFLFSRISYIIFRLIIIIIIYYILRLEVTRKWRMLIVGTLIPFTGSLSIQNWGYNANSVYIILLTSFLLYFTLNSKTIKKRTFLTYIFISGFLSAIAVFAHQGYVVAIFVYIFLIYMNSKKEMRVKTISVYCLGGVVDILIVIIPIIMQSGWNKFIYGVESILIGAPDNYINTTIFERAYYVISIGIIWWCLMFFISIFVFAAQMYWPRFQEILCLKKEKWLVAVSISIIVCWVMSFVINIDSFYSIAGAICLGAFVLLIPTYDKWGARAWYIGIHNILFIVLLTITSLTGDRFYYCIPIIIPILVELFKRENKIFKFLGIVISVFIMFSLGYVNYKQIYRDDIIENLTYRIEDGVYKGIFTTKDRARDVVELEEYLEANIDNKEKVAFRDCVPIAYLMRYKNICDVRTWDIMQYSYNCNDPTVLFRYYKNKNEIPDVIVYIDFGRDEKLSIEKTSNEFQYNNFVNEYYYLDKSDFENKTFRVLIYRNNRKFDGDYEQLLNSIEY